MTKKERLERYVKAYEDIASGKREYMCCALVQFGQARCHYYYRNNFPEFWLLSPEMFHNGRSSLWFNSYYGSTTEQSYRLTILAFAIAMCED